MFFNLSFAYILMVLINSLVFLSLFKTYSDTLPTYVKDTEKTLKRRMCIINHGKMDFLLDTGCLDLKLNGCLWCKYIIFRTIWYAKTDRKDHLLPH